MGDLSGGTTGKRQARAFTSFIEAANFRSKCLVIKQAKGPSARPRRRGNIIRMACLYYVRVGEIGIPEVSGLGEATGGSSRFVTRPFCELGPASTNQVLGASSADISIVPSGLTLMCRPEKVCTAPCRKAPAGE